jgi:glycosyltransferase involved in cell wall biosynthesis
LKALFVANTDWYLYNFRIALAEALRDQGVEVVLVCPPAEHTALLRERGFRVVDWRLDRGSLTPLRELAALKRLWRIFRTERPDMVHNFTIKPDVYGTLLGRLSGVRYIVNSWTGLGFPFEPGRGAKAFRYFLTPIMRFALRSRQVWNIFQNQENLDELASAGIVRRDRSVLVQGSGVSTERFAPPDSPRGTDDAPNVLMTARLLRDKGVREFVEAARKLRFSGSQARFMLAGSPDETNRQAVSAAELEAWRDEGIVEFLGQRDDLPALMHAADIGVLPSYHEGLSRFLLEAAASGLPLVASDIEGCRPIVHDGVNGILVPPRNVDALAEAISRLAGDGSLRKTYGDASRALVMERFSDERNIQEIFDVYRRIGALS